MATINVDDLMSFHTIGISLYLCLVRRLGTPPNSAKRTLAFWLWLEHVGLACNNLTRHISSRPDLDMARFVVEAESCINVIMRDDNDDEEEMGSVPFTVSLAADERGWCAWLSAEAYESLREAFKKGTRALPVAEGVALFDTCYDLSRRESVEVPTVAFHFVGGKSLALPAKNYLDGSGSGLILGPSPHARPKWARSDWPVSPLMGRWGGRPVRSNAINVSHKIMAASMTCETYSHGYGFQSPERKMKKHKKKPIPPLHILTRPDSTSHNPPKTLPAPAVLTTAKSLMTSPLDLINLLT
ncbi:Protein ASPARTIC PROTEASE IN GUARD CELL 1 [Acorus calamus]|uniref:Protein ASPARTIC PROTEASE IN GUARD CELL 1 n=1 Tax=Acorus calamus TaxID=4465 RepID=A0AAV9CKJ3_ACOCL|nr:Protein ASPARTIC PROTEASE IN GUARD CELL 1 [Acorus calamus]